MKVLVHPHDMELGGSQLNAIELAGAVRSQGHEVAVFGRPGALEERVEELDLEFIVCPESRVRPSPAIVSAIRGLIRERGFDIVHGYEWPPALHARLATRGTRSATVCTIMSMAVAPFIPRDLPILVGTEQIAERERAFGRTRVRLCEPPVDLSVNDPDGAHDRAGFRRWSGADPDSPLVVVVGRLSSQLKLEGLLVAARTFPSLGGSAQLVIVGEGEGRDELERAASSANRTAGRAAVLLPGSLSDPRPAYAAAEVVLGMGGSVLRGMAFGKPVVVQGERGFWSPLTPETLSTFLWQGWYGIGSGAESGPENFVAALGPLLADAAVRRSRGLYGLEVVRGRFSLEAAARTTIETYRDALDDASPAQLLEAGRATLSFSSHALRRKVRRRTGRGIRDDFNNVAASGAS